MGVKKKPFKAKLTFEEIEQQDPKELTASAYTELLREVVERTSAELNNPVSLLWGLQMKMFTIKDIALIDSALRALINVYDAEQKEINKQQ